MWQRLGEHVMMHDAGLKSWHWGRKTRGIWNSKKQPLAATCNHSSGLMWPQVAARASGRKSPHVAARGRTWPVALLVGFEISRAASLAATCSHKWPHVAAWTANTSPNGPTLENLKKLRFWRTAFFDVFCETWGESWNERKEITNRREELTRKDGRNEMDKVKGKEELNEQDRRVDTKAQTQRIERKSWNGRKN